MVVLATFIHFTGGLTDVCSLHMSVSGSGRSDGVHVMLMFVVRRLVTGAD